MTVGSPKRTVMIMERAIAAFVRVGGNETMTVFHRAIRVVPSLNGWTGPSPICQARPNHGNKYLSENNFAPDDWLFAKHLSSGGVLRGYTSAAPTRAYGGTVGNVLLVTFDRVRRWEAVGCLLRVSYVACPPPLPNTTAQLMFDDLQAAFEDHDERTIPARDEIIKMGHVFRWQTSIDNAIRFGRPISTTDLGFDPASQRYSTAFKISPAEFQSILQAAGDEVEYQTENLLLSSPVAAREGDKRLHLHYRRERNYALVALFKSRLEEFACEVCGFNFETAYGDLGRDFIECHHTRPVAELHEGRITELTELAALCANCHRMVHRRNPPFSLDEIRSAMSS